MERSMLLLLLAALPAVIGFTFPTECAKRWNGQRINCCLSYNDSLCGGLYSRGTCMNVAFSNETSKDDWRRNPVATFCYASCSCRDNFRGANCGDCIPGYRGVNCDIPHRVIRRNFTAMNETERMYYLSAIFLCSFKTDPKWMMLEEGNRLDNRTFSFRSVSYLDMTKYAHQCTAGAWVSNGKEGASVNMAHNNAAFCTWHRSYLIEVERSLQECMKDPNFGLAYLDFNVDWAFTDDYLCSTDSSGRFNQSCAFSFIRGFCSGVSYEGLRCPMSNCYWERPEVIRRAGMDPDILYKPLLSTLEKCVNSTDYRATCSCMEGVHNTMHGWCSGDMGFTRLAPNDVVFLLFHCFMDSFLERMIIAKNFTPASYPNISIPFGHGINDYPACLRDSNKNPTYLRLSENMGYIYDFRLPKP